MPRSAAVRRRRDDRRLRPRGQARLRSLQAVLLLVCVLLVAVWARQDWHRGRTESLTLAALSGAPAPDPWGAWLDRNGALFALCTALLLLAIDADRQGVRRARRLERERRRALHDALHDALTRLPNRRAFDRRLRRLSDEGEGRPASLLFLDLDGFKQLNDTLGHEAGDAALVRVAAALRTVVPPGEGVCCRWGGDEFVVLLPQADRAQAERVAARLERALQRVVVAREGHAAVPVRGSIGIATLHDPAVGGQRDLLRIADEALAEIKRRRPAAAPLASVRSRTQG